jgi:hypothetical protein
VAARTAVTEPGSDGSRIAQVDESVSMAVLLLLERPTPVERAVFLLGEIFDYTHAEIAGMLGVSVTNPEKLSSCEIGSSRSTDATSRDTRAIETIGTRVAPLVRDA